MRIKFLRRVQYESEGRNKGPIFDKDSVHDFDEAIAQRWLRRGVAQVVGEASAKEPEPQPELPPPEDATPRRGPGRPSRA